MATNPKKSKNSKSNKSGAKKSNTSSSKSSKNGAKAASAKKTSTEEETFPADAPGSFTNEAPSPSETPREIEAPIMDESPEAGNRFAGEQPAQDTQAPTSDVPEHLKHVGPRTAHNDELKLEKFILANRITRTISDAELSKSGINMTKINLLTGRIGKFKLKRGFRKEKFLITIVE